jgi:hypothetical protein
LQYDDVCKIDFGVHVNGSTLCSQALWKRSVCFLWI